MKFQKAAYIYIYIYIYIVYHIIYIQYLQTGLLTDSFIYWSDVIYQQVSDTRPIRRLILTDTFFWAMQMIVFYFSQRWSQHQFTIDGHLFGRWVKTLNYITLYGIEIYFTVQYEKGKHLHMYVVGSKLFRPDQLFKVTEMKQLCYFST
jgi:hypothetical protein